MPAMYPCANTSCRNYNSKPLVLCCDCQRNADKAMRDYIEKNEGLKHHDKSGDWRHGWGKEGK